MFPMINVLESQKIEINNFDKLLNTMIDKFIETHTISKKAHEELITMSHLDSDISAIFKNFEFETTEKIVTLLENPREKVHIIINMVDNLCHEIVYHKHHQINYDIMKNEVINIIKNILK